MNTTVLENRISALTNAIMSVASQRSETINVGDWFSCRELVSIPMQRLESVGCVALTADDKIKVLHLTVDPDETLTCYCRVWYGNDQIDEISLAVSTMQQLLFNCTIERADGNKCSKEYEADMPF